MRASIRAPDFKDHNNHRQSPNHSVWDCTHDGSLLNVIMTSRDIVMEYQDTAVLK